MAITIVDQILVKRTGWSRNFFFELKDLEEIKLDGQSLTGSPTVTFATGSPSTGLTIGTASISGTKVIVLLTGGTVGTTYTLECNFTLTGTSQPTPIQGQLVIVA